MATGYTVCCHYAEVAPWAADHKPERPEAYCIQKSTPDLILHAPQSDGLKHHPLPLISNSSGLSPAQYSLNTGEPWPETPFIHSFISTSSTNSSGTSSWAHFVSCQSFCHHRGQTKAGRIIKLLSRILRQ